ncbi:MAG: DNA mismatch repair protein MutS [Bacteroidia bacterium]
MQQYNSIKAKHPGAILLFRVGDFYETFGEDAVKTAGILGIVLTKRSNGAAADMELAGFPHHALDTYLPKLVRAGQRVAICEQLEDPKTVKTIVKRDVTEMVTPGVAYSDKLLDHRSNNYLAAIYFDEKEGGIAFVDVSTGEFHLGEGPLAELEKLMQSFRPAEVLYQKSKGKQFVSLFGEKWYTHPIDDWAFTNDYARETLLKRFETSSLKGFGVENMAKGVIAAGIVMHYLNETQHPQTEHISGIARIDTNDYVWMDRFTIRNLELLEPAHEGGVPLIQVIDHTKTPMGARMLKRWLVFPLKQVDRIRDRQEVVQYFSEHIDFTRKTEELLSQFGDLERLVSKVAVGRINPRELVQLRRSMALFAPLKALCSQSELPQLMMIADQLNPCQLIFDRLTAELQDEAPVNLSKGGVIASGVSEELDKLRHIAFSAKDFMAQMQAREIERTGISSLKINFNNVFGFYLEVTNAHKDKVPQEWIRKQTLVNAERYITEELKEFESQYLTAEEKIARIEEQLFNRLVEAIAEYIQPIQLNAQLIARIDCLLSFNQLAEDRKYSRPEVDDSEITHIEAGRHPVIETRLKAGDVYVPNDIYLDSNNQQILMITGPNMAGKSALLRQTALISLLAQIGCYVPAKFARIGLVDKIFTRVGATDNISSGESTFMVEMNETASILNNISARSLILLDEIGRGTSTYDGISIAWAIAEYLHEHPVCRPRTLFATHYHELNEMAAQYPRIHNFNVSIREHGNKIIFLRKLVPGGSEHSFGIHVARMAGVPQSVVRKADALLEGLEQEKAKGNKKLQRTKKSEFQMSLFEINDPQLAQARKLLEETDINRITPVEALFLLNELKKVIS